MISSLSATSIKMACKCGEQFNRRYIKSQIIPPSAAAGCGRGVHEASRVNFSQKMRSGVDLPEGDLTDAARDGFIDTFKNGVFLPKEKAAEKSKILNDELNKTITLTKAYRKKVAPPIQPISTEERISIDIGLGLPLLGFIDYEYEIGSQPKIGDLKTTTESWNEGQINQEIQPLIYSFLYERDRGTRPTFDFEVLVALKTETKHQHFEIMVESKQIKGMLFMAARVMEMIKTGLFMPADRSAWWCSEQWCGYWGTCKYVGN